MQSDAQVEAFLRELKVAGGPAVNELSPAEAREAAAQLSVAVRGDAESVARIENATVPAPTGEVPVRIYTPEGTGPFPALMYFHGGGWMFGDLDASNTVCTMLANRVGAVVVSVDYRLAPENKFPAAVIDAYVATHWAAGNAAKLNLDASRLAVVGDSSGANVACAVTIVARDMGSPKLQGQALFGPVTNRDFTTVSYSEYGKDHFLTKEMMEWFWSNYLAEEQQAGNVLASPLRLDSAHGLPSAFVATAERDPVRDEGEAYASLLRDAGTTVVAKRYSAQIHGFVPFVGAMDQGKQAIDDASAALREFLNHNV